MKKPCQNSAPNNSLTPYPVKSGGYSFIGRLLTVLIPAILLLTFFTTAHAATETLRPNGAGSQAMNATSGACAANWQCVG